MRPAVRQARGSSPVAGATVLSRSCSVRAHRRVVDRASGPCGLRPERKWSPLPLAFPTSLADENPLAGTEPLWRTTGCPAGCVRAARAHRSRGRRHGATPGPAPGVDQPPSSCFSRPTSAPLRQWAKQSRQPPSKTPSGWSVGTSSSPSCTWPHSTPSSTQAARFLALAFAAAPDGPCEDLRHRRPGQRWLNLRLIPQARPAPRHCQHARAA